MNPRIPFALAFALAAAACGDDSTPPTEDTAADAGADVTADGGTDATTTDTADDADPDASTDTTGDATPGDTTPDVDPTADRDNDGLTDLEEITIWGTAPIVADTDGDGFSDKLEVTDLAFDPEVNNYQFNPLVADRPQLDIVLTSAPAIYAIYNEGTATARTIGEERSESTSEANARSWGGGNSYSVEMSHTAGATLGFEGFVPQGELSYEFSYSTTRETSSNWSNEQTTENAETLAAMEEFEESTTIENTGGIVALTISATNSGDVAYFLDNLTLSAYEIDPLNPTQTLPIGTLTYGNEFDTFPRTRLEPGETSAPLNFDVELDLPTIQALLANSRNLMIAPGTWLLEGDGTVDFELAATAVNARTAEIIIDYGFERPTETYRVTTVANEDRNYITVDEALTDILRIPYTEGVMQFRRSGDDTATDTEHMLTGVRDFAASDEDTALWTVVHNYPINNGADSQTDVYHPFATALDFGALQLQKGHTLQLIRISDADRDSLGERAEYAYGSDPNDADSDGDGCEDGFEVNGWTVGEGDDAVHYRSDPTLANTDFDFFDDCEEFANGTNPMGSDNIAPTASIAVAVTDGAAAEFDLTYADAETGVVTLEITVDDRPVNTVAVSGSGVYRFTEVFATAGVHTITARAWDGDLYSAIATVNYTVSVPTNGLIHFWPIAGASNDIVYGETIPDSAGSANGNASAVAYVTGRDGAGRGSLDVKPDSDDGGGYGLMTAAPVAVSSAYTYAIWLRAHNVNSGSGLFGQLNGLAIGTGSGGPAVYDLRGEFNNYVGSSNRILNGSAGGEWNSPTAEWIHVAVTVDGTAVTLYVNGAEAESTTVSGSLATTCELVVGHPSGSDGYRCSGTDSPEAHESGVGALFDDLRIYNRALSENEVAAIWLND